MNSLALLAKWDRDSLSWKTSQRSLLVELETFSERFPTSGMMRSGELFERPTSEHRTEGSASSLWPTPDAGAFNSSESVESFEARRARIMATGINGNGMGTPLGIAVKQWPTPTTSEATGAGRAATTTGGDNLRTAVSSWPTPTTEGNRNKAGLSAKSGDGLQTVVRAEQPSEPKTLNPAWVEQLMGFPSGWTDGPPARANRKPNGKPRARAKKPTTEAQG